MEPVVFEAYGSLGDPALLSKYGSLGEICQAFLEPIENKRISYTKRSAFVRQPDELQYRVSFLLWGMG